MVMSHYCGEREVMCRFVKSLCCPSETNIALYVDYTSRIKERKRRMYPLLLALRSTGLKELPSAIQW